MESPGGGGGLANSDGAFDGSGGYQRQDYWDTEGGNVSGGEQQVVGDAADVPNC